MTALRKWGADSRKPWTEAEIMAGLLLFAEQNGHYPTAHEFDAFEYLPSARSIQRSHRGLVTLRKKLLPKEIENHTQGVYRQGKAREADQRAKKYEEEFYEFLTSTFMPIAVHEHKIIRPGGVASDFFIYLDEVNGVVIDLFYAQDIRTLGSIVSLKLKRYSLIIPETYLVVVGNPSLTQSLIDVKTLNRKNPLPSHVNVVSEAYFKEEITPELRARSTFTS